MTKVGNVTLGWSEYPTQDWAVNIYLSGCDRFCDGCQNPSLADSGYGQAYSVAELHDIIVKKCKANRTNKLVFLGGDPLYGDNPMFLNELIPSLSDFHTCVYTGYELDFAKSVLPVLNCLDYIKTGRFIQAQSRPSKKTDTELVLSSPNQTMYRLNGDLAKISSQGVVPLQTV